VADKVDDIVVVLTACVNPAAHSQLRRSDAQLRMKDYLDALTFWLTLDDIRISGIVLLENSGYDGEAFQSLLSRDNRHSRVFEYISIVPAPIPPGVHYGWAEFKMLDEGIERSQLCRNARFLLKATGRYTFPNVTAYLDALPPLVEVSVHCRNYKLPWTMRIVAVGCGFFLTTPDRYRRHFRGAWQDMSPTLTVIEFALWRRLMPFKGQPWISLRFSELIRVCGHGGTGDDLDTFGKRLKWSLRRFLGKVAPWWWI